MLRALLMIGLVLAASTRWVFAEVVFPRDHGPHPDHRLESWYFSGQVTNARGKRFGFHLGFFRLGVRPEARDRSAAQTSAWRFNEVFRAELGFSDLERGQFQSHERLSRGALSLAGITTSPFRLWVYDWFVESDLSAGSKPVFRIRAAWGERSRLELDLEPVKAAVVPGQAQPIGRQSSRQPSAWYSLTRMVAEGRLLLDGRDLEVSGEAWLDRLWRGASYELIETALESAERGAFLSAGQIAVNRFALQLDNGWELLLFQLHRRNGTGVPVPSGMLVYADGSSRGLSRDDIVLSESEYWSGADGVRYPARWNIVIPGEDLDVTAEALIPDQEVRQTMRYWSGAVGITGTVRGRAVAGNAHVALVGYDSRAED